MVGLQITSPALGREKQSPFLTHAVARKSTSTRPTQVREAQRKEWRKMNGGPQCSSGGDSPFVSPPCGRMVYSALRVQAKGAAHGPDTKHKPRLHSEIHDVRKTMLTNTPAPEPRANSENTYKTDRHTHANPTHNVPTGGRLQYVHDTGTTPSADPTGATAGIWAVSKTSATSGAGARRCLPGCFGAV